ncbi:MAG: leucyl aminopeptidase [Planctomycetota bacterium]
MPDPTPAPIPSPNLSVCPSLDLSGDDILVVGIAADDGDASMLTPSSTMVDQACGGRLAAWAQQRDGLKKCGHITMTTMPIGDQGLTTVVLVGLGRLEKLTRDDVFRAVASSVRSLSDTPCQSIAIGLGLDVAPSLHDGIAAGALFACEYQSIYRKSSGHQLPEQISLAGVNDQALHRGRALGHAINLTRRLVNEPPTIMNPSEFADRAVAMASDVGLKSETWDEAKLAAENCEAILAVGRGSSSPPRLVTLRHDGGGDQPPVILVGKGVTFDSGGLSLKPSDGMVDMKCDMAGAATVVGVMRAVAELNLPLNVVGICGLAENMVSGDSYKLGDVIQTRSGKTIEILNTDAEGRVVLADALDVACDMNPAAIVDLATLTGACMVALGQEVAGLMTNQDDLASAIESAAQTEGEPVWQLPMFELYDDKVQSKVADIKNVGEGRWGGAITAAKFLENFVRGNPWLHIDIAGPAFADSAKSHRDAGATGVMVRTLVRWLESSC